MSSRFSMLVVAAASASACGGGGGAAVGPSATTPGGGGGGSASPTFADEVAFLAKHGPVHVLESPSGARVALSAKYQGRVMTSAVSASGKSFGWINHAFIEAGKTGTPFDNYGGEDRFWLGPEGGQFGLYFSPGKPFTFDNWQVPAGLQEGAWEMAEASPARAVFRTKMTLTSWSGTTFEVEVERTIALVEAPSAERIRSVAFETVNKITNKGKAPWRRESGLLSVWILAMYSPSADTRVVIPYDAAPSGTPVVNDAYFGKVPAERLMTRSRAAGDGFLVFTCDGKERGKIGVGPARAKPMLGSYSSQSKLLTVVQFDKPKTPDAPYVNSMWEQQKAPYAGDVVNSYNDGSPGPGKPPLGGFYEIETSSPGAELAPGQSLVHTHRTFHMVGDPTALAPAAQRMLGVSLADLPSG